MKVKDKVIVVTGAGSGMGRELTLQLLSKGARVAMADINEAGMQETMRLAGDKASGLSAAVLDITDREKVNAFPEQVIAAHGCVDGVINNAGIIQPFIPVNDLDYDRIQRIMQINFFGPLNMVKAFLPQLLKRPEAHIANVASMGAFIPFPGQTMYGASKAAVKLLTEGLHSELKDTRVKVTLIMPGAVNTNIMSNSGLGAASDSQNAQAARILQPDRAAAMMIRAIEKDRYRVLVGKDARFLDLLYRLSPVRSAGFIAKQMKRML